MNNLTGDFVISGDALGDVTIACTNADGSMRNLSDILADCRVAFDGLSESEQANTAEALVGKNAMSGFLALMNAAPSDIEKLSTAIDNCDGTAEHMAEVMQDNLGGQLTILKSQLEELAMSAAQDVKQSFSNMELLLSGKVDGAFVENGYLYLTSNNEVVAEEENVVLLFSMDVSSPLYSA